MKTIFTYLKRMSLIALLLFNYSLIFAIDYTEDFSIDTNWTIGTGYGVKTYTNPSAPGGLTFYSDNAYRDNANANSGYAFRVRNVANAFFRAEFTLENVTGFKVKLARWSNKSVPSVTVRYSVDGGATYNEIGTISGNDFAADKTYQDYSYTFPEAISPNAGSKIYIEFVTTSGERMLYDEFTVSYTEDPNTINEISDEIVTVVAHNGQININNLTVGQPIEVYNTLGQKIAEIIAVEGRNQIAVTEKGLLIVRVGKYTTKVVMK